MDPKDTKAPTQGTEPAQTSTTPPPAPAAGGQPAKKGYGKRPMWQWIVLYLVIAVVVYFVVYLLFIKDNSVGNTGGLGY